MERAIPMEYVWSTYGIPMEYLWNDTLATRPQQANNALSTGLGQAAGAVAGRWGPGECAEVGMIRLRYSNNVKKSGNHSGASRS